MENDTNTKTKGIRATRGFSLVEMLTVIGVIGTITAIAIPMIGNISEGASDTTARSNARNLASISGGLASIGTEHVVPESLGGIEATCRLLRIGVTVPDGAYAGEYFGMPGLALENIPPAVVYLDLSFERSIARRLVYNGPGE